MVKRDLVNRFWFEEIPKLYAQRHGVDFQEALETAQRSYDEIGDEDIRWYLPQYWFQRFDLEEEAEGVIEGLRGEVKLFPEVREVLGELKGRYKLIVISNAARPFLEVELEEIEDYFEEVFSCVSDLNQVKKGAWVYREILEELGAEAERVVHVGDNRRFDYLAPREAGMNSLLVDRNGSEEAQEEDCTITNLKELVDSLEHKEGR